MRHATQIRSYAVKNASAPGTKSKKLKASGAMFNGKKSVNGVKDNRKFQNDKMLSEAEKMARRMDLENIKNKLKNHGTVKGDKLFSGLKPEKEWETDPMLLKVKQLGKFDEGLNDSSDEGDEDENVDDSGKYFVDGKTSVKNKKKTLEDMIRESKVKKFEKQEANEKLTDLTKSLDLKFKDKFRHILPKLGATFKALGETKVVVPVDDSDFNEDYGLMMLSEKPVRLESKKIENEFSENKNKKLVSNKVDRLREHLKKAGIINDKDNEELNASDLESDEDEDVECVSDNDDSENEEDDVSSENEEDDVSSENKEDDVSLENEEDEVSSENEEDEVSSEEEEDDNVAKKSNVLSSTISELKSSIIGAKGNKRKLENDDSTPCKKVKLESDKTQLDCLRVLLQTELKNEALLVLSSQIDSRDFDMDNIVRKLILATLFQAALKANLPNSYSPELIRFLRTMVEKAAKDADHWLSMKSDISQFKKDQILNLCTSDRDASLLALSSLFHTLQLIKNVIACNAKLPSRRSLFEPFNGLIKELPMNFYPKWLIEEIDTVRKSIDRVVSLPESFMTVKKQFKIVELMEPDLEDKFDPKKNVTKMLKKKIKTEKKALKKDVKMAAQSRVMKEVADGRKSAQIRDKKTLAIINNMNNI